MLNNLKLPDITVGALNRLATTQDFRIVIDFLKTELEKTDHQNRVLSGEILYRSQGSAITLAAIIGLPETAAKVVKSRG